MKSFPLFAMFGFLTMISGPANSQDNAASIKDANTQFYKALNAVFSGHMGPMDAIWSHADDVTYMGPDGTFQTGWEAVRANWAHQASLDLGGTVMPEETVIHVGSNLAVVHTWEKGENVDDDGNPLIVSIRATNTFRKENGAWKMVGHHTDRLDFIDE